MGFFNGERETRQKLRQSNHPCLAPGENFIKTVQQETRQNNTKLKSQNRVTAPRRPSQGITFRPILNPCKKWSLNVIHHQRGRETFITEHHIIPGFPQMPQYASKSFLRFLFIPWSETASISWSKESIWPMIKPYQLKNHIQISCTFEQNIKRWSTVSSSTLQRGHLIEGILIPLELNFVLVGIRLSNNLHMK